LLLNFRSPTSKVLKMKEKSTISTLRFAGAAPAPTQEDHRASASPCRSQCRTGDLPPHQANLRKGRLSEKLGLYSITKCCAPGSQLTFDQKESILQTMLKTREQGHMLLHAFVVMPDHLHMLITLSGNRSLPSLMREFARQARISAANTCTSIHWQRSFYDHKVREQEPVTEIVTYIENNPLRMNLVATPTDWLWSSLNEKWKPYLDREFLGHQKWEVRN
jgi:putative transposase